MKIFLENFCFHIDVSARDSEFKNIGASQTRAPITVRAILLNHKKDTTNKQSSLFEKKYDLKDQLGHQLTARFASPRVEGSSALHQDALRTV